MSADRPPTLLVTGTRVYTADPLHPWADALVIRDGSIGYVGSTAEARAEAGSHAEVLDLPGGLTIPGLNDSHLHMTQGAYYRTLLALDEVTTLPELQECLRAYRRTYPERTAIEGFGLRYEPLGNLDRPEREALDEAVADLPVVLRCFDGHTSWANTAALRQFELLHGPQLPHPKIVIVDAATGLATGRMKEKGPHNCVIPSLSTPSEAESDGLLVEAMRYLNSLGITSVQNMDGDPARLEQYERLRGRGLLSVRANHHLSVRQETSRALLQHVAELAPHYSDSWNHMRGIKLCIDGVIETKTALLLEPYADGSGERGVPDIDLTLYREIVLDADRLGLDVATHAVGDRSVRLALDAYEAAQQASAGPKRRHRVEHIELCHPADLARFTRLGVTASFQPLHAVPGADPRSTPWVALTGPEREPSGFPWRALAETGVPLCFGSDWPCVTADVRGGLHAAVTRTTRDHTPPGGWQPQHCVTLAQALDAYTRGAAYAEREEQVKGMLRVGLRADLTIFAQDLFTLHPEEIPQAKIAATIVDGAIVYRGR